ncbi:MAG: hypothetical protein A3G32_00050 [Deltaproteobacteria bacterium RIFCSPLOWO2_12_FULL_40_28]|nr:MAG: hypothetical protein A3C45_02845 [Deltaproteobacteria bacterium RIFCSPHIGHO2_02_FULL_40_28]OGQ20306.1 MAG: hypothetical protein A3E27_09430 [Deltaproteobacteria bacterium RIFCSPHIGHO2_12_FULL_40_32]OGQ40759.1 MAG: hypothetical protein A3I69_09445 [Deltaproteobacteria bacterium RIFCSPLOWO2_02_FULL_40_36]OGQ54906.1 MAG: hypothetical protein A3G32_00050 [Deltaproteobacteria bacterium RIFCSPLOWO2_12_FULL_40_28]
MYPLSELPRILSITIPVNPLKKSGAVFLWGARGTGKTTYLKKKYPKAKFYDLLQSDLLTNLQLAPHHLREEVLAQKPKLVIIDEVQKNPPLIDEVHWLLENTSTQFILCGSSARKLKRESKNLLGGRATSFHLFPLVTKELPHFDLNRALSQGLVPLHYMTDKPKPMLKAYVQNYLREEIIEKAIVRNIPSFARFLNTVALTHGQLLNYANIAREVGVSPSTVREYYQILEDTLLGHTLEPWKKVRDRRLIETAKFYLFDVGVALALNSEVEQLSEGTDIYGNAFEHLMIEEVKAYLAYSQKDYPIRFWRTASGYEVDLIVENMKLALEFKSTKKVAGQHLKGLKALVEEHKCQRVILVSREENYRKTMGGIELMHWQLFCKKLWDGELV